MTHTDIGKLLINERGLVPDTEGYLFGLPDWDEAEAGRLAQEEGVSMNADHWEVVRFLRERFRRSGQARSGRVIAQELDLAFSDRGGRRYLYRLFPGGPVAQGSRIAGLPLPAYTVDPSFGSSE